MNNLKVSTRMLLLTGVLSALLLAVSAVGLLGIYDSHNALKSVYGDNTVPAEKLGEMRAVMLTNRLNLANALITATPERSGEMASQIDANIARADKAWAAYAATRSTPEERKIAQAYVDDRTVYMRDGLTPALAALRVNDLTEVRRVLVKTVRPLDLSMGRSIDALVQIQVNDARAAFDESTTRSETIRMIIVAVSAAGVLFAGLFGVAMVRSITGQLGGEPGEASRLAHGVAGGDLSVPIHIRQGDTTSLMVQLKAMQDSLVSVVGKVRRNSESVATASAEIATGNNDLSSRTEQQASALEKTAASMEQLNATVRQNADNARQAEQLASSASGIAVRGGAVVGQVVATMKDINDSSHKIADITGVIDSIAFQTNILALNAAVEAARAGEQGRGFAVVASEVRSLASRSASAAREIKSLIGSSVEKVQQGSTLVDQAGATMTEVVQSIKSVSAIVAEISAASAEQSEGVAQIGEAIGQLDEATQQNAALVEQSAAAAESLRQQAQQLVEGVAVFRLGEEVSYVAPMADRELLPTEA